MSPLQKTTQRFEFGTKLVFVRTQTANAHFQASAAPAEVQIGCILLTAEKFFSKPERCHIFGVVENFYLE